MGRGSPAVRPRKRLGQHFLHDPHHLARIADAADLSPTDVVLEIGPGTGTLTEELLRRGATVVAVELDDRLVAHLQEKFAHTPRFHLVHGDILDLAPDEVVTRALGQQSPYKVVANLPYYITSAIMRHLLESERPPTLVVVTVQEEVGQRMCASPPRMNLLAVSVQFYGHPRIVHRIPRGAFYPVPKVNSVVVRIDVYHKPAVDVPDRETFFRMVKAGFGQRRKQLVNALAAGLGISKERARHLLQTAHIAPQRRAETLSLEEWARLTWAFHSLAASNQGTSSESRA